jgi:hypothetical protein
MFSVWRLWQHLACLVIWHGSCHARQIPPELGQKKSSAKLTSNMNLYQLST